VEQEGRLRGETGEVLVAAMMTEVIDDAVGGRERVRFEQ